MATSVTRLIRLLRTLIAVCFAATALSCSHSADNLVDADRAAVDRMRAAIDDRLSLMVDVAIYKILNDIPVEDLAREAAVLNGAVAKARNAGLDEETAIRLVTAQMTAAKARQSQLLSWGRDWIVVDEAPDLARDLRPRIAKATDALIDAYAKELTLFRDCRHYPLFAVPPAGYYEYGDEAWRIAIDGLFDPNLTCGAAASRPN